MVLDIDEERRRISLGIKQCKPNPWREFADNYNRGDRVSGQIRSITDFGLFIGLRAASTAWCTCSEPLLGRPGRGGRAQLPEGADGRGDRGRIDPERERISLSVKQLAKDPFSSWIASTRRAASSAASSARWMPRAPWWTWAAHRRLPARLRAVA